jgi:RHS repeat-associated protein
MTINYNALGNITSKTVGSKTFTIGYDSTHKHAVDYVTYGGTTYDYIYDANGNMTQGYDFTNTSSITKRTITWNADNMPNTITYGSSATTTLLYDGTGTRAKKTVGSTTTYYIGDHYEIKGGVAYKYIFAGNLRVAQIAGSTVSYFHKDHLGSSTVMTNSSGTQIESTNYEPFGGMRAHSGTTTSGYKFTDQELDAENGLYNYDARLYDPIMGRFITPDTIVPDPYNPQSLNRYAYCLNNPLRYTDPSGHVTYDDDGYPIPGTEDEPDPNAITLYEVGVTAQGPSVFAGSSFVDLYQDWLNPLGSMLGGMFVSNAYAGVTGINGTNNQAGNNNTGNYNAQAAVNFLKEKWNNTTSQHRCAKAVRQALNVGGIATPNNPVYAKDYKGYLTEVGFKSIALKDYKPQLGDVAVFPGIKGNQYGHIEMYDGTGWRSDYVQPPGPKDSTYGSGFFANQNWAGTSFAIFRYKEDE